ncbi:MAG TPA: translation elongation factor Ts, partial [Paludibacteraceae bacterium]|nr:translation elongation factor Ts [Paludibacteraceae bacterium]
AKNADFIALTQQILDKALETKPATLDELNAVKIDGRSIADLVTERSGVTGEKMEIGFYETVEGATTVDYIHPGNKLASLVAFAEAAVEHQVARDIAMQVAAMNPIALNRESVPAKIVEEELKIGREKAREEGKPENMLDKIAEGRLNKFYQEATLVEQAFIKDGKMTVSAYAKANKVTPTAFRRVTLNEE